MKKRIKKKLFKKKMIGSVEGETNIKIKNVDKKKRPTSKK